MKRASVLAAVFAFVLSTGVAFATDMTISTNTTWSGTVTIDGKVSVTSSANLTIQPGTTINFVGSTANLHLTGAGTLSAQGTAAQPINFTGSACGNFDGAPNKGLVFDHCNFSGLGGAAGSSSSWFNVNPQSAGLTISNSSISNCGAFDTAGPSSQGATISNTTITNVGHFNLMASTTDTLTGCKINGMSSTLRLNGGTRNEVANNVIVNAAVYYTGAASASNVLVHDNYIDCTNSTQYCLEYVVGQVYNNFVHGGSWTLGFCGGRIYNNVIESCTAAEAAARGDTTHEQLNDFGANATVEHNIVIGNTMGSFMTASIATANNCIIRNNTFDQRCTTGSTASAPIYLNHLGGSAANMTVENNLFMRGGRIYNEMSIANAISYVDYNCWAGRDTTDSFSGSSARFVNVVISGKSEGQDGFGMHDVTLPTLQAGFNTSSVVANASYTNPYTDAQMLAGACTPSQLVANYWSAYTPVPGAAVIDVGDPNSTDPLKLGSRIDIGAVEAPLPVATYLPGDFNKDHIVDYHDYLILEGSFGKSGMTWADGDANNDSLVDYHDYLVLEQNFGKTAPEPVTLSLLATGAVALLRRKR